MNCKNANQELGFDRFCECNFNLHWSFSNFNRMLIAAEQISKLHCGAVVLELGAGTSDLENIVKKNFRRSDIEFVKIDGDKMYESDDSINVLDITSDEFVSFCLQRSPFDAVVFMEVIEHLNFEDAYKVIERIFNHLSSDGLLLLTTPTPPMDAKYECQVWPTDHDYEFTYSHIYSIVNRFFKINKEIGWSLEEREYNNLLATDATMSLIKSKLSNAFPESYVRAIIACLAPIEKNRQILFVCKKRRIANGRFAQAR